MNRLISIAALALALSAPAGAMMPEDYHVRLISPIADSAPAVKAAPAALAPAAVAPALPASPIAAAPAPLAVRRMPKLDWNALDDDDGAASAPVLAKRGPKPLPPFGARAELKFAERLAQKTLSKVFIGSDPVFDRAPLRSKELILSR